MDVVRLRGFEVWSTSVKERKKITVRKVLKMKIGLKLVLNSHILVNTFGRLKNSMPTERLIQCQTFVFGVEKFFEKSVKKKYIHPPDFTSF